MSLEWISILPEFLLNKIEINLSNNEKEYNNRRHEKKNVRKGKSRENVYSMIKDESLKQTFWIFLYSQNYICGRLTQRINKAVNTRRYSKLAAVLKI